MVKLVCVISLFSCSLLTAEKVELYSVQGKKVIVELLSLTGEQLKVRLANGKTLTTNLNTLSDKSIKKVKEVLQKSEPISEDLPDINAAIGAEFFNPKGQFWDSPVSDLATRLNWRKESETNFSSSYRSYPRPNYGFLNARPYSVVLFGDKDGKIDRLSLVYANKGDYNSSVGSAENHFKPKNDQKLEIQSLADAMERDYLNVKTQLSEALGDPIKQRFGEKDGRTYVLRWDYQDVSFLLSEEKSEYIRLQIVKQEVAEAEGKIKFIKDADLKGLLKDNIENNEFGDVYITNIPMVNQGPKGYCAPATFERAMRYMRVPADMYILATLATAPGGGTNTTLLADKAKRAIRSKARRIKDFDSSKLKMRDVKKFINKGIPIMWTMRSLTSYNDIANKRSNQRDTSASAEEWATPIAQEAENVIDSMKRIQENHHICMIIGYNEATQEIAVSDSWGPRYAIRWIHIDIASAVSSKGSFVVDL